MMKQHKKRILKKDFAAIVLRLHGGDHPADISKDFPEYTEEQIYVAARTAGFGYIKRNGQWYAEQ